MILMKNDETELFLKLFSERLRITIPEVMLNQNTYKNAIDSLKNNPLVNLLVSANDQPYKK